MSLRQLASWPEPVRAQAGHSWAGSPGRPRGSGHRHFWERALPRRQFLQSAASAAGLAASARLWLPALAYAESSLSPRPISGGLQPFGPGTELFHVFLPEPGNEPSTVGDFNGTVGLADITGVGVGTDTTTNIARTFTYEADVRFMDGQYAGVDGQIHEGTFGFV